MRSFSLDIRSKLAGMAFGLVSIVVVALTMHSSAGHVAATERALQAKALTYGQLLAREAEAAIAFGDVETTRELFEAASLDAELSAGTLYRASGAVLGATGERTVPMEAVSQQVVRQTPTVIAVITPVVSKEGPRGVLVLEYSLAGIREEAARGRRGAVVAGLVAAAIGLCFSWLIGGSFARRVRRIQRATQAFTEGNHDGPPLEDTSTDEIGQLGNAFNAMAAHIRDLVASIERSGREEAARLDRIVVARTLELQWKNEDLAIILDNAGQGFVSVARNGRLAEERSAILKTWFGSAPEGVRLWDYVTSSDPEASQWLQVGWEALFEGILPTELALDQLPKEVRRGESTYGLRYQPVFHDGAVEMVVLVVSDVSDEIARRRAEATQRELAGVFARLVADRAYVEQFVAEGTILVHSIQGRGFACAEYQRWIHTLKGNASFLGLESLAKTCHEMETQIAETGDLPSMKLRATLGRLWADLMAVLEPLMVGGKDRTVVRTAALQRHIEAIESGVPRDRLAADLKSWLNEPTSSRLTRAAAQATAVARRLEKPDVVVTIEDHELKLDPVKWGPFWSAFVHVVRNAVDHGIEDPDTRLAAGKPPAGCLALRTFLHSGELVIEIEDDGAGIKWDELRARVGASAETSESELVELLFRDGVTTKMEVSETSGRGVGLGAARAECERLGGRVDLRSRAGLGTRFSFRFPRGVMAELPSGLIDAAA